MKSAFLARGDSGNWEPPYATVMGIVASAELSQTYLPGSRTQYTLLGRSFLFRFSGLIGINLAQEFLGKKLTSNAPRLQVEGSGPVLREGTPVELIAVDGFTPGRALTGNTVRFVLAQELSVNGKVLATTGDIASGEISQAGDASSNANRLELERVKLVAGTVEVPLRSDQTRGVGAPVQYKELPDGAKFEVRLFVAKDIRFPNAP